MPVIFSLAWLTPDVCVSDSSDVAFGAKLAPGSLQGTEYFAPNPKFTTLPIGSKRQNPGQDQVK